MNNPIPAVYENGMLRLLAPLELPEHTQVQIYVEPVVPTDDHTVLRRQIHQALIAAGLSLPVPEAPSAPSTLTEDRREELAQRFAIGGPLSALIIEERQER